MPIDLLPIKDKISDEGYAYIPAPPQGLDYPTALAPLGPMMPQYDGGEVRDIRPHPAIPDDVISANGTTALRPHTEWYEFPGLPPRYVVLLCVRQCDGPGGETTLADGYRLVDTFTEEERTQLLRNRYEWRSHPTLESEGVQQAARHSILEFVSGTLLIRFSTLDLQITDELSAKYVQAGLAFFSAQHIAIKMAEGSILIWDNWRMIHARNAFTDRNRHLRRVLIGDDRIRSRRSTSSGLADRTPGTS